MFTSILSLKKAYPARTRDADLPDEDGEPLETDWHRLAMNLLIDVTACHLQDRQDYFVGGNMFIYYREKRDKKMRFRGPDFFLVWGVPPRPARRFWAVWKEGHFPDVIIELASPSTIKIDKTIKKSVYQKKFQTHEYFIYDPAKQELLGWRLVDGKYKRITPDAHGRLWCEELGLSLGTWQGRFLDRDELYVRFFDHDGLLAPTFMEVERREKEAERREKEAEKQRADRAEAELARLRAEHGTNGRRKK